MTKKEIVMELEKYGIYATLRPRKAILVELLERVKEEHKKGQLTSDVAFMDDVYYACNPKKVDWASLIMGKIVVWGAIGFLVTILIGAIGNLLDLPISYTFGLLGVFILLIGIPLRVWLWEREKK